MSNEKTENQSTAAQIATMEQLTQGAVAWLVGLSPRSIRDAVTLKRSTEGTYNAQDVLAWASRRIPSPDLADAELERALTLVEHLSLPTDLMQPAAIATVTAIRDKYGDAGLALITTLLLQQWLGQQDHDEQIANDPKLQRTRERQQREAEAREAAENALKIVGVCDKCKKWRNGREWKNGKPPQDYHALGTICPRCTA